MRLMPRLLPRYGPRLMAGWRTLLARRPWIYWLVVIGVAGLVAVAVTDALAEVRDERDSWGETTTVHVAVAEIRPGDVIAALVETRSVPLAMVPASAVRTLDADTTARQQIASGEIVVDVDVSPMPGPLALLPNGWLAVSVDDIGSASFTVGDHAVVLAAGSMIAPEAVIVAVAADATVIGVPAGVAPAVAEMIAQRLAVIALANG